MHRDVQALFCDAAVAGSTVMYDHPCLVRWDGRVHVAIRVWGTTFSGSGLIWCLPQRVRLEMKIHIFAYKFLLCQIAYVSSGTGIRIFFFTLKANFSSCREKSLGKHCLFSLKLNLTENPLFKEISIVGDPDPGSSAFLTPGSGIRNRFFPDPGSQTHIFESLVTIFLSKKFYNSLKIGPIFFFSISNIK